MRMLKVMTASEVCVLIVSVDTLSRHARVAIRLL